MYTRFITNIQYNEFIQTPKSIKIFKNIDQVILLEKSYFLKLYKRSIGYIL